MTSIFGNLVKDHTDITDKVILTGMMVNSKTLTSAYFTAAMSSTTPELRAMLSSGVTQMMGAHAALTDLAIKNDWEKPYISASEQLANVYQYSVNEKQ